MNLITSRRAVGDLLSVCRNASPTSAARWISALALHLQECVRCRSLEPADRAWTNGGAQFRPSNRTAISLPPAYTSGAREMYCRNVYLRTGLVMPSTGWVVDLGANRGLFAVWAALTGARVVAVEAQQGFAEEIRSLATYNRVTERVMVEIGVAGGLVTSGAAIGMIADEQVWATASHAASVRPKEISVPELMSIYDIDRVGLLKMDIEGGEFAVLSGHEDLAWLGRVDQIALEVHPSVGDAASIVELLRNHGFSVELRDNQGSSAAVSSPSLSYAYCRR
jgi:FkbM family methyltransferase